MFNMPCTMVGISVGNFSANALAIEVTIVNAVSINCGKISDIPFTSVSARSTKIFDISSAWSDSPVKNDLTTSTPRLISFGRYSPILVITFASTSPTAPANPSNPFSFTASVSMPICSVPN